jgi:GrpB-like predicted nucleotidyltransferase (UPF0157 family)
MKIDGAGNGRIELIPYHAAWQHQAAREIERLVAVLGNTLIRTEHIGSTSIPGLAAKPIIDLLPIVRSHLQLDAMQAALEAAGYLWRGEFGLPGRRYCIRDCPETGERLANVHMYELGSPQIARHVAFRDYLRAHPSQRIEYEAVKRRAAQLCSTIVNEYNDAKSDWIRACEQRAIDWASCRSAAETLD